MLVQCLMLAFSVVATAPSRRLVMSASLLRVTCSEYQTFLALMQAASSGVEAEALRALSLRPTTSSLEASAWRTTSCLAKNDGETKAGTLGDSGSVEDQATGDAFARRAFFPAMTRAHETELAL
eukprot:Gregarina_sp_Poly_1__5881@NODE_309_length_9633_cov_123_442714_g266_i0_p4_GENE_NODE_309_length_9633_cov_123_442714_g266_i0NODE_309_length_9633_cov_123_442714_g266_i0_p4_ORF_typecomplete_len124_score17_45_NODE_309_length_9633_cov_123_442714_g266_i033393710